MTNSTSTGKSGIQSKSMSLKEGESLKTDNRFQSLRESEKPHQSEFLSFANSTHLNKRNVNEIEEKRLQDTFKDQNSIDYDEVT
jgi:hypothetical protein